MAPSTTPKKKKPGDSASTTRRRYNSPLRQQQSAATRERIIAAGAELVRCLPDWDWTNLTARAIGARANVSERTVHRYFPTERKLRDAVLQRLVEESGIDLGNLTLESFADTTAGLLSFLSSFAASASTSPNVGDPTLISIDQLRCQALLQAVCKAVPDDNAQDLEAVAALLDLLWSPPPYERLISAWRFDKQRAIGAITWLIKLIEEAVRDGRGPGRQETCHTKQ
jgi:AcrR family transcriptional regulator